MTTHRQGRRSLRTFLHPRTSPTPPPLGRDFSRLWTAAATSNLGDGVLLAASPLLAVSLSTEPIAIAAAVAAQQLPWLLFALVSGAVVDRLDRRRLMIVVNAVRALVMLLLCGAVLGGILTLPLLYLALFLVGTAETLADTSSGALLVGVVGSDQLGRANARLSATATLGNQLIGPPVGAFVFTAAVISPFALHAALLATSAVLIGRIRSADGPPSTERPSGSLRAQIAEGVRWLHGHRGLRALTWCIVVMNVTFMTAFATWVLYARTRLGLDATGFGLLLTAGALGGLTGAILYGRLEQRFGRTILVRAGLIVEALTHLVLAVTREPGVAYVTMMVFGVHAVVWGTVATTVRQRATPVRLQGRVASVYLFGSLGGAACGSVIGGVVAQLAGLSAPFYLAGAGVGVLTVLVWRPLAEVDVAAGPSLG